MLLIWLLLIPSAVATFDCRGTCNLCDVMNKNPATAACTLCSECTKSQSRRRLKLNKQKPTITNHQEKQMKNLEKMVMKGYGLKAKDFIDSDNSKENVDTSYDPEECIKSSECVGVISEDNSGKYLRYTLTFPATTASIQDSTTGTPKECPPIKPCKKALNKIINKDEPETSSTLPSFMKESTMKNIMTLNLDYEVDDQGCPIQPICSDDEDYTSPVTKRGSLPSTSTSPTTNCRQKRLLKRKVKTTPKPTPCVPCMPYCALPCGLQQIPPFLPASIPQAALEALITLKSMTDKPNVDTTKKTEVATKRETEGVTEETTKEFMYFYVGIPKDGKNLRNG